MGSLAVNATPQQLQQLIYQLRGELAERNQELERARQEVAAAREALRSQQKLRQIFGPLHNALQEVFGELHASAEYEPEPMSGPAASAKNAAWESWKQKLPGKAAAFITELLIHGEMTGQQLMVATKCSTKTLYRTINELNKAQLLNKNGGKYSLKAI